MKNPAITMPEIVIYNTLQSIIRYIRRDLKEKKEKETILYKLLGVDEDDKPVVMNNYNYFIQAKKMFEREQNFTVNIGYNFSVAKLISLHIILPSESASKFCIGEDEGYRSDFDFDEGKIQERFTQSFDSTYQIMITSDNGSEVNVTYHILKSMLIAVVPHLSLMGLLNPKFSGQDIVFQDDTHPAGIFHRVLNISFEYELTVPQLLVKEMVKGIFFDGTAMLPWIKGGFDTTS